ncbi:gastric inhibitory polypeptide receptor isoform X2 [Pteropus vampyrus]|uniref:Gastric inhibitory polypeptide receptor isoform X2 n=1 Tax=Pteropus vampyrus TaxID=132908 RepID=A0A6P6CUS4_PTEVA|nr:gastric inhibitory polypeptide receptor isoform X2 [Pteropus vampyrus]
MVALWEEGLGVLQRALWSQEQVSRGLQTVSPTLPPPHRRLRCTRNYIHINLFASFMLRAAAILTRDRLLPPPGPSPGDQAPPLWNQALAACRTAQIVTQYCVGANYTWLLVEGIYLHSLLALVGGSEGGHFRCYLLLGWGAPALFVIPWVIVRYLYENTQCWERNDVKAIWWIIRTPILMTILINFIIFIRILGILLSKLRTRQMRCPDYRLRLARSTLTLVPLLGVHEVVFAPVTEEQARGALRLAKLGFEIFFSSFQIGISWLHPSPSRSRLFTRTWLPASKRGSIISQVTLGKSLPSLGLKCLIYKMRWFSYPPQVAIPIRPPSKYVTLSSPRPPSCVCQALSCGKASRSATKGLTG